MVPVAAFGFNSTLEELKWRSLKRGGAIAVIFNSTF